MKARLNKNYYYVVTDVINDGNYITGGNKPYILIATKSNDGYWNTGDHENWLHDDDIIAYKKVEEPSTSDWCKGNRSIKEE